MDHPSLPKAVDLTIVLPVRDEATVLLRVLEDIRNAFAGISFEIVALVDMRSLDHSPQLLARCAEACRRNKGPPMRIIQLHPPRCGSGFARRIGSSESRGALVGWMDADGTYQASDLRCLFDNIRSADQLIGARSRDFGRAGRVRLFIKWMIARVAALLWRRADLVDLNSGLRIFRRDSLLEWLHDLPDGFSCTTTATLAALNRGQKVRFVPISYFPRDSGTKSKFHPFFDTARLLRVGWLQWRCKAKTLHRSAE
jgi:glycosyltransferase involved in cell wall biosynthesis